MNEKERLEEIIAVIKKYHLIKDATPVNVRLAVEDLGPTFVKLGQIMASRDDMIPREYTLELSKLKSNVRPMSFSLVMEILDREYNGKTLEIFKSIEQTPIGSASIAQVHKAILSDGKEVVIKIRREHIYEMMDMDVKLLKRAISLLHVEKFFNSVISFNDALDEIFNSAKEEMDFSVELDHMLKFIELNKDVAYIKAPTPYKEISTKACLVMECVNGIFINDIESLEKQGYDRHEVASKLASNYIKQAIDDGFFHADPHTSNLKLLDGKIVYLDFGMMGILSNTNKSLLNECIAYIIRDDIREVSRVLLMMGKTHGEVNHMKLNNDIRTVLDRIKNRDVSDIDMTSFLNDMLHMLSSNNITLPSDVTMLIRGILTIEGTLKEIDPSINLIEILSTHVSSGEMVSKNKVRKVITNSIKSAEDMASLPNEALNFLQGVNRGELKFNIELNDSKNQLFSVENLVYLLIFTILDVAFIIGTSLIVMNNHSDLPFIFYLYFILGCLCTLFILYKFLSSKFKR